MNNRTKLREALLELNSIQVVAAPTSAALPGAKHVYVADHQADDRVCRICGMLPGGATHVGPDATKDGAA